MRWRGFESTPAIAALWALAVGSIALAVLGAGPWTFVALALALGATGTWWTAERRRRRRRRQFRRLGRKRARARREAGRLDHRGESLLDVLDRVDAPVLAADGSGVVTLVNASAEALLDRPRDELQGLALESLFTQRQLLDCVSRAAAGRAARSKVSISWHGTPRVFEVAAAPLASEGGGVVLTLADVTELSLAMKAKTDFVANASHELRTPLAAIAGAVETLAEECPADVRERLVGVIARNARRLEELLEDLLELSRLESGSAQDEWSPVDLAALIEELRARFDLACSNRGLRLVAEIEPRAQRPVTSRRLLEVVLSNLIDNATRFAREGTTIVVRAAPQRGDGETLVIEVADQGVGIPLADQQRIFERFYQVDRARAGGTRRGTGLGLAIVKHATQLLGGSVGVVSVLGRGSTFRIELPGALGRPRAVTTGSG